LFLRRMPGGFVEAGSAAPPRTRLGRLTRPIGALMTWLSNAFYNVTYWMTRGVVRRLALVVVLVVIASAGAWYLIPPRNYLPSGNQNLMFAFVISPPGYSVSEYRRMGA